MIRKKKILSVVAVIIGGVMLGAWIAGEAMINRTNPPERYTGVILSPEADPLLKRACFDCHSNETSYPDYSYLPVASLLLANHVREGRQEMNLSLWNRVSQKDRAEFIEGSLEQIRTGGMPTRDYLLVHQEARLTPAEIGVIEQAAATAYGVKLGGGKTKQRRDEKEERAEREKRKERGDRS